MKDKYGVEIQVGDTIEFRSGDTARVLSTSTLFTWVKFIKTGHEESFGFLDSVSAYIEIIKKANQTSSNIHELQKKAQEDIQGCISKYITEFNNLGFEFDVTIDTYDIRTISECKPSQLLDVKVTAVLN